MITASRMKDIEKGMDFGRKAEYELKKAGEDKGWEILAEGYRKTADELLIEVRKNQPNPDLTRDRLYTLCNKYGWFTCGSVNQYQKLFDMRDAGATTHELAVMIWICSDDGWTVEDIQKALDERMYCAVQDGEIYYIGVYEDVERYISEVVPEAAFEICEYAGQIRKEA